MKSALNPRFLAALAALLAVTGIALTTVASLRPAPPAGVPLAEGRASSSAVPPAAPAASSRQALALEKIHSLGLHWEERVQAVRDLPAELDDAALQRLFAFLSQPPQEGDRQWYLICNEIMEVVRKRNLAPGIYTASQLGLIQSAAADPMIRDYAAQHLAQWISGMDGQAMECDREAALAAFQAMRQEAAAPANRGLTLAGTMLAALTDAVLKGREDIQPQRDALAAQCLSVLSDESYSAVNRSTALQAAARLQAEGLAPICRRLAADEQVPVDLRLSSIAGLGLVGHPEDIAFLQSFAGQQAFQYAAAGALKRLRAR